MKSALVLGSILAVIAVILGAFGAHTLSEQLGDRGLVVWKTAQSYHMTHALAIILAGLIYSKFPVKGISNGIWFLLIGVILFSGSLYLLSLFPDWKWLGPVTPIGGLFFIIGWLSIIFAIFKSKSLN